jgi:hypothetical protein
VEWGNDQSQLECAETQTERYHPTKPGLAKDNLEKYSFYYEKNSITSQVVEGTSFSYNEPYKSAV